MKKLSFFLIAILLFSCEEDGTPEDRLSSTVTANIEGELPFVSIPNLTETIGSAGTSNNLREFKIVALGADGKIFSVRMEGGIYDGVGVYDIKDYNNENTIVSVGFINENGSWCGGCPGGNDPVVGQIEITAIENDEVLTGTFSLVARNSQDNTTKDIDGTFEITLNR